MNLCGIRGGILFRILESYLESFGIFKSDLKYKVIPNLIDENSLCRTPRAVHEFEVHFIN